MMETMKVGGNIRIFFKYCKQDMSDSSLSSYNSICSKTIQKTEERAQKPILLTTIFKTVVQNYSVEKRMLLSRNENSCPCGKL